ncbi:IclR family transcriptional regulator [Dactylosporangium siamense]|uniref:IclR family transcriptional regulator n=1 Tax=Dactylosporangium siamense TaxID=685454 RepID=A0A919PE93_9ACTN|nr:IclR family transcriptional regulator [Dactylosporangium siamense]GIG42592.1 IclR family transcriptional regulator [Dactylosporangium siamense]
MTVDSAISLLGKAQRIVDVFGTEDDGLSLGELVRRSGLAKATVYRICQELTGWGLLERSGTDYRLGLRLFEIGQRVPRHRILAEAARPHIEDVFLATGESVHLAVRSGLTVLYLEKLGSRRVSRPSRVGGHLPLHSTSTGKVILAHSPQSLTIDVVRGGLTAATPYTVTQPGHLTAQLARVRRDGYFTEFEETRLGYLSVAVPLFGPQRSIVAALAVTAPTHRANVPKLISAIRTAGERVTTALTG